MKATFAVAFAAVFVAFISVTEAVKCPPQNENDVTLLPNPKDCTSYYLCNEGIPWLMKCPDGLEFNARLRVCDLPKHANCSSPATSAKPPISSPPPSTSSSPSDSVSPLVDLLKHRPTKSSTRPPKPTKPVRPTSPGTRPPKPTKPVRPTSPGTRPPKPTKPVRPTSPGTRPPPTGTQPSSTGSPSPSTTSPSPSTTSPSPSTTSAPLEE